MRTRWLMLLLCLSIATNVTLGTALWVSWHCARPLYAALTSTCSAPLCNEEKTVREELATSLCAPQPDRFAVQAKLARLDEVRSRQRWAIVDQWLNRCSGASPGKRATLAMTVRRMLCPWQSGTGVPCCAPTPGQPTRPEGQPQHGQS